ncbi:MAG: GspH/FimT family pseudopilin [Ottowia sp.]
MCPAATEPQASRRDDARGFTLIEMMVVIAITAILILIGMPSLRFLMERNAIASQVNTFIGSVTLARSEAIKRNASVVLCRSENADTADEQDLSCATTGDWKSGWIVFMTHDSTSNFDPGEGDVLLRVQGPFKDSGGIQQSQYKRIQFRNSGIASSGVSSFTFDSVSKNTAQMRRVCVSITGRVRLIDNSTDTCS